MIFERARSKDTCATSSMTDGEITGKELSAPFATGGGGTIFENQVQTAFVVLMLTGGAVPCLPPWPIVKVKLQGRYAGYQTDDFIVFVEQRGGGKTARLLAQIKHVVSITENDSTFSEVIAAAWLDFNNPHLFDRTTDVFALICGPLSAHDTENARTLLEWARHSESAKEFIDKVNLAKFSSPAKRNKLQAFRAQLKQANSGTDLTDEELWQFLKSFHLLGYDFDIRSGVALSLMFSHISQFENLNTSDMWANIGREVASFNQNAGTVTLDTISQDIRLAFSRTRIETIPPQFATPQVAEPETKPGYSTGKHADAIALASLLGAWNEKVEGDRQAIEQLIKGDD